MHSLIIPNAQFAVICRQAFSWAVEHRDLSLIPKIVSYYLSHLNDIPSKEIRTFLDKYDAITAPVCEQTFRGACYDIKQLKMILECNATSMASETGESYIYIPAWEADVFAGLAVQALRYVNEHPDDTDDAVYDFWEKNTANISRKYIAQAYFALLQADGCPSIKIQLKIRAGSTV